MSWSVRRQLFILLIVFAVAGGILFLLLRPYFTVVPICTDGKKNGDETGIDCGGSCRLVCMNESKEVIVKWARTFQVSQGLYSAVAYIENQNIDSAVYQVPYEFRIYDENRQFIASRTGTTYIGPNNASAIFEGQIKAEGRIPRYTTFTFTDTPRFVKADPRALGTKILARDPVIIDRETKPKLSGTISNASSLFGVDAIDVIALVYGTDGNVIAVSKTYVESLAQNGTANVYFTWPSPFTAEPGRIEIIPRWNVLSMRF